MDDFLRRVMQAREREQRDEQERAEWENARKKGATRRGRAPAERPLSEVERYRLKRAAEERQRRTAEAKVRVSAERAERARNIRRRQMEIGPAKVVEDYLADLHRRTSMDDARARAREQLRKLELKQARQDAARKRRLGRKGAKSQAERDAEMALALEEKGLGFVLNWKPEQG